MISFLLILLAPVFGGLIYGIERVLKARIQNRQGPPVLQPFYDFFKLMDKRPMMIHSFHASLGVLHFIAMWVTLAIFILGGDLLMVIFFHLLSSAILIIAGFSVNSTYSQIGGVRELLGVLSYEPILILSAIAFYMITGSFEVKVILESDFSLLTLLPMFIALLVVLPIKLKKSPFDVADAHQEIIGGVEIEYSGIFYEALYTAKWLEYVFAYAFIFLFAGDNYILGISLVMGVFLLVNLVDNSTARVSYSQMLKIALGITLPLGILNLFILN